MRSMPGVKMSLAPQAPRFDGKAIEAHPNALASGSSPEAWLRKCEPAPLAYLSFLRSASAGA